MYINVKAVRVMKSDSIFSLSFFFPLPSHKLISLIFNVDFFVKEKVVNIFFSLHYLFFHFCCYAHALILSKVATLSASGIGCADTFDS